MRLLRAPNALVAVGLTLALLASLGPHLLMVGYSVAGARPPAALLYFCPLHQLGAHASQAR
ncbi:MAG: hypothetical protein JO156_12175 [Solirubrobacterales bacterium]|nr:hypothetical protein [Solirubrobacterales bacterium]